jgi:hypothetical protein
MVFLLGQLRKALLFEKRSKNFRLLWSMLNERPVS